MRGGEREVSEPQSKTKQISIIALEKKNPGRGRIVRGEKKKRNIVEETRTASVLGSRSSQSERDQG